MFLFINNELTLFSISKIVVCSRVCEMKENQENVKKTEKVIDAGKSKDAELGVGLSYDTRIKDNGHLQSEGSGYI